ncbi:MAG TPA: hypothetical protein DEQ09_04855, partial [Bacteroidales bacterium]|nr:hypothetical protein [Bacteroidales bacterium]
DNIFKTTCVFPDGSYYFALEDIEGSKDLLLSVTSREAANIKLSVNPDFEPLSGPVPLKNIYLTDQEIKYVRDMITDYRLENIYRDTTLIMTDRDSSIPDTGSIFYGNPDRVIFIDDYIKLPDMRELIFEVVKEITVRKNVDDYIIKVIGEEPMPRIYNPLILIDGIPLLSYSRFLDLPPERFRKIDIINSLYIHGNQGFAGVVNFISMNGDMAGLDLPEVSRVLSLSLPGPTISGEIINTTLYNSDFPFLSRTLSYFSFSGPADGSLTIKLNPLYDDYITILSGISYNKKWLSVSSPFEINGFLIR